MNTAVYMRVSTTKQTTESQRGAVDSYLAQTGVTAVMYEELPESGAGIVNRPVYLRLLEDIRAGKVNRLVVYALDRLTRDSTEAMELIFLLDRLKVELICISQNALSMEESFPLRRTVQAMFADIAQMERKVIRARLAAGRKKAQAAGIIFGKPPKLTAEKVAAILALYGEGYLLSNGQRRRHSIRSIALQLGIPKSTVHEVITDGTDVAKRLKAASKAV